MRNIPAVLLGLLCLLCTGVVATAQEAPLPIISLGDPIRPLKATRGLTSMSNVVVERGQWVMGINASFSTHTNKDYTLVVIEGINSAGHTVKVSPMLSYAFRDNMVVGGRFGYSRTFLKVDGGGISLGDDDTGVDIKVDFYYSLKHAYEGIIFWRQYIPFGESKRFALFNEVQLGIGGSQAKFAADSPVRGTYETGFSLGLSLTPGLVAFVTNDIAFELNVGVLGLTYNNVKQVHNQVSVGRRSTSMMNFKVNLFSIGLGMAFYL